MAERSPLVTVLVSPFEPLGRRSTYLAAVYLALAFPIGLAVFVALVTGVAVGVGLAIVWVGLPLLVAVLAGSRALAGAERRLAAALLGTEIEPPPAHRDMTGSIWRRLVLLLRASSTWRSMVWSLLRLPLALLTVTLVIVLGATAVGLVWSAVGGPMLDAAGWARVVAVGGGVAAGFLTLHAIRLGGALHAFAARHLLGPSRGEQVAVLEARTAQLGARAELARELHDSVGHSVTASVLQAAAARRVLDSDPEFARAALLAIEEQGREALTELDRVLALLRDEASGAPVSVPDLGQFETLIARTTAAGVTVAVDRRGDLEDVPQVVSRQAYRVVQEGLTNAMRHASGAPVAVLVERTGDHLHVLVESEPGVALTTGREGGGRGLRGLSERTSALGGELRSARRSDGGFVLEARLPLGRIA